MNNLPFETPVSILAGVVSGPIFSILFMLTILVAGALFLLDAERGRKFAIPVVMLLPVIGAVKVMIWFGGVEPSETTLAADEGPGMISQAFDWLVSHGLLIAGTVGVLGLGSFIASRFFSRKANQARIKADVRELLAAAEHADEIEAYWTDAKASDHKADRIATVARARNDLLQLLAVVHNGQPLTEEQRRQMGKANEAVERCAKDSAGITVVPRDGFLTATERNQTLVVGVTRRGAGVTAHDRLTASRSAAARSERSAPATQANDDSLNLLHPLNPLSAVSATSMMSNLDRNSSPAADTSCRNDGQGHTGSVSSCDNADPSND